MKLMIWGGNLALTGGDIFAFPDWKEVIRKVGQYGFTPLLSTKIPLKEDDIYFLKESGIKFLQFSLDSIFPSTLQTMVRVKEDYIDNVKQMFEKLFKFYSKIILWQRYASWLRACQPCIHSQWSVS